MKCRNRILKARFGGVEKNIYRTQVMSRENPQQKKKRIQVSRENPQEEKKRIQLLIDRYNTRFCREEHPPVSIPLFYTICPEIQEH